MSKDLEKEYKALMSEDAPDLWDRIEAGLEPKQPVAKKVSFIRKYRAWGMAAAAVLCLAVIVPFMFGDRIDGSGGSGSSEAAPMFDGFAAPPMQNSGTAAMEATTNEEPKNYEDGAATAPDYSMPAEDMQSPEDVMPSEGMQSPEIYTVRATVALVRETEDWVEYDVKVCEDSEAFFEGTILYLYDQGLLEEPLVEGETYLFDVSIIDMEEAAFLIENARLD